LRLEQEISSEIQLEGNTLIGAYQRELFFLSRSPCTNLCVDVRIKVVLTFRVVLRKWCM
jgi:hypothetical protein